MSTTIFGHKISKGSLGIKFMNESWVVARYAKGSMPMSITPKKDQSVKVKGVLVYYDADTINEYYGSLVITTSEPQFLYRLYRCSFNAYLYDDIADTLVILRLMTWRTNSKKGTKLHLFKSNFHKVYKMLNYFVCATFFPTIEEKEITQVLVGLHFPLWITTLCHEVEVPSMNDDMDISLGSTLNDFFTSLGDSKGCYKDSKDGREKAKIKAAR
ncbi:hypothetical protein Syun_025512 [Stephania yunnanensis]|uniref:Uncharacterized protein n=1 Tax=Stephania yunnanensis TaxID=152371 RepID=A0AAP0EUQ3_9MAGN